jgi:hypothetical protein
MSFDLIGPSEVNYTDNCFIIKMISTWLTILSQYRSYPSPSYRSSIRCDVISKFPQNTKTSPKPHHIVTTTSCQCDIRTGQLSSESTFNLPTKPPTISRALRSVRRTPPTCRCRASSEFSITPGAHIGSHGGQSTFAVLYPRAQK